MLSCLLTSPTTKASYGSVPIRSECFGEADRTGEPGDRLSVPPREDIPVRFIIEIHSVDLRGIETVLRRVYMSAIDPAGAKKHAQALFANWKARHATRVRVLTEQGEELYNLTD
jgi:hypothetical protein